MIEGKKVLAMIPARGGSKGLPRKNVRPLAGRPLIAWPITAARESSLVDRVIVSTDDDEIAQTAAKAGADVPFMRPPSLASDTASSMDVVRHSIDTLASANEYYDYIVMLEPTSPLTDSVDVDRALTTLHQSRENADSIVGISQVEATHPEYDVRRSAQGLISPFMAEDFRSLRRRQEIEELYFLEGSLYISTVEAFIKNHSFYHARTMGYPVPRWKSFEIDDFVDLVCVEAIMANLAEIKAFDTHLQT